ncbi:metal ABC transporter solute-binding protein, Zn/Mn family [Acetobacter conturbans]|uniref:Metal ABC transporter substrate-binding protein n=1 Tax=Acetobacter conturbans TaxID=1737472 RepID=A0ABX0JZF2_9PROT|nr:zinc ABC transporter substrate-binding protein [Acetobacter conturbans]NHN88410.1 metal ABC transporter substrate-binding protein [Acetobacter conturbans]
MRSSRLPFLLVALCLGVAPARAADQTPQPTRIVAAENVWGDIAAQIGGTDVVVESILSAPDIDPHLFEPVPTTARDVANSDLVILNGAGFDPWMSRLSGVRPAIRVADIAGWHDGDNPHLWFDPVVVGKVGEAVAHALRDDPRNTPVLRAFEQTVTQLEDRIAALRKQVAGMKISATEPLLGRLTDSLGLVTENTAFQLAVMNDVEPGPAEVARFENDLRNGTLRLLIYNKQTVTPSASRLLEVAKEAGVPSIAVTETLPPGMHWQGWMSTILDELEAALLKRGRA